jgi:glycosyltransferase involved in cell wall biosynthesis
VNACTIVARNYFPAARLLARTFLEHHPQSTFSILVLDADAREHSDDGFQILSPYDIGIDRREVHRMAMIYDVKELATAVKPWLLRTLAARPDDVAVYFDPDIEIFEPFDDVAELAREHGIVLTPHMLAPLPNDGLLPDDLMILQAGTYNLGFIAVGPGAGAFVDWWSAKLERDCLVAVDRGQFVDQRWVDFVPVLFEHYVLRDPTCNVAYWNLHERDVVRRDDGYEVDGRPLRFFHFSGFDPRRPRELSTHLGRWARVRLTDNPALTRLCADYAARLLELGYREDRELSYRFDTAADGTAIDARMRRLYREALEQSERGGIPEPPDPFDSARGDDFMAWLNEPVGPGGLSRYLTALYRDRQDLQARFPFVGRLHRDPYLRWVGTIGRHEERLRGSLVPDVKLSAGTRVASQVARRRTALEQRLQSAAARHPVLRRGAPFYFGVRRLALWLGMLAGRTPSPVEQHLMLDITDDVSPGINVAGYFRAELGIAEVARKLVAAVRFSGLPFATITYGNTVSRQDFPFEESDAGRAPYDTNLVCINADQLHIFARDVGQRFFANRHTIGVWFWEVEAFPAELHGAFDLVDEVWVASEFVQSTLTSVTRKPVTVFPVPLKTHVVEPLERSVLNLPEGFLFFFTFDFMSIVERKNPFGLIEAFKDAFQPGEGAALVVKSINGDRNVAALERVRAAAADHEDIQVIDGYLSAEVNDRLMAACDCYVSLHRSEGLGLTMAEAMGYGKPVIATAYAGNLAFMDEDNSYLVPYELVPVGAGADPYPADAVWADPDLTRAAALMRHVFEDRGEARKRGARARRDLMRRHSLERTADFIVERLDEVHGRTAAAPAVVSS